MNDIFENNKQNLLLINEIVANYRKQNFFVGRHSGRRFAAVATENTNKAAGRRHTAGFGLFGKQYVNPERKKRETLQSTSECAR